MPKIRGGGLENADDAVNRNIDAQNDTTGHAMRGTLEDAADALDDTSGNAYRRLIEEAAGAVEEDAEGNGFRGPRSEDVEDDTEGNGFRTGRASLRQMVNAGL